MTVTYYRNKWHRKNYLQTDFSDWVPNLRTRLLKQWKNVKMRTKQQAFTHAVKSTWNQSRKQGYGEKRAPWHYLPWHYFALWSLYEIIHICTEVVDESEEWSSQSIFQFKQLERRSLKKSGLQRDSNPWPPRYRCDALPTGLWSQTLGARSIYWFHIFPCSEMMWSLYEIILIDTAVVDESEEWSSQ